LILTCLGSLGVWNVFPSHLGILPIRGLSDGWQSLQFVHLCLSLCNVLLSSGKQSLRVLYLRLRGRFLIAVSLGVRIGVVLSRFCVVLLLDCLAYEFVEALTKLYISCVCTKEHNNTLRTQE
jgi:hypothetical protein